MKPQMKMTRAQAFARLGLTQTATRDDIQRAYRRLARKEHPDQGGSHERFAALAQAMRIASGAEKGADEAQSIVYLNGIKDTKGAMPQTMASGVEGYVSGITMASNALMDMGRGAINGSVDQVAAASGKLADGLEKGYEGIEKITRLWGQMKRGGR